MDTTRWYVTSAIPYVNATPHLGHALEFVQADTLARWRRLRGDEVRSLWGTDDNAAKNATAARTAGVATQSFVDHHAEVFAGLREPLQLGFDDFIRTSHDPRHRPAVERLWGACRDAGDLYRDRYEGLYCSGCERFYEPSELADGRCIEHDVEVEHSVEENWFFRLSRYAEPVLAAVRSGEVRVTPEHRRNEIVAFLAEGVRDISVSRPAERSGGWGIPVPGDASQVVYVWFDALTNYISALGYGTDADDYGRWWTGADRRVHVVGKDILRFHAAFWPAFLLSAGEPLPTDILVHEFITVDDRKISKSFGTSVDPREIIDGYGADALRWWLLRDVHPTVDTDFRLERLVQRHDQDLANGVGNLVTRVLGLIRRSDAEPSTPTGRGGIAEGTVASDGPIHHLDDVLRRVDTAAERLDHRAASAALWELVESANGYVDRTRPWELLEDPARADDLAVILGQLLHACRVIGDLLEPFLPLASQRISDACSDRSLTSEERPAPLFPRLLDRG